MHSKLTVKMGQLKSLGKSIDKFPNKSGLYKTDALLIVYFCRIWQLQFTNLYRSTVYTREKYILKRKLHFAARLLIFDI